MKSDFSPFLSQVSASSVTPAPSLRVPVTAANRDFLRWLRSEELSAWQDGRAYGGIGLTLKSDKSRKRHC